MGVSIHGCAATVSDIVEDLEGRTEVEQAVDEGKLNPTDLLDKIMPEFGTVDNGRFYTVWNEYYDDYSPANEFMDLVARYYGMKDYGQTYWYFSFDQFGGGANADEVAETVGIQLDEVKEEE